LQVAGLGFFLPRFLAFETADETAFLFGTGVNQPNGIIPGIPANMQVATAAAGTVTADDMSCS
jgi:HK97 family phage major capsid protein